MVNKYEVGKTYGNFTVVKKTDKRRNGKLLIECTCICGKTLEFTTCQIRTRKSCGCIKRKSALPPDISVGEVYKSNNYGDFVVTDYCKATDVTIKFLATGTVRKTCADSVRRGLVLDPMHRRIYNIGYIGMGTYRAANPDRSLTPCYRTWVNMLARCYNRKNKGYSSYGGRGVVVAVEWHCYQKFCKWFYKNYRDGYVLDKDILKQGNKVYGPDTCCFVPMSINQMFIRRKKSKDLLPRGVYANKDKFIARSPDFIAKDGGYIGSFSKAHDAFVAYKHARESIIKRRAESAYKSGQINERVYEAMINWQVYPYT